MDERIGPDQPLSSRALGVEKGGSLVGLSGRSTAPGLFRSVFSGGGALISQFYHDPRSVGNGQTVHDPSKGTPMQTRDSHVRKGGSGLEGFDEGNVETVTARRTRPDICTNQMYRELGGPARTKRTATVGRSVDGRGGVPL